MLSITALDRCTTEFVDAMTDHGLTIPYPVARDLVQGYLRDIATAAGTSVDEAICWLYNPQRLAQKIASQIADDEARDSIRPGVTLALPAACEMFALLGLGIRLLARRTPAAGIGPTGDVLFGLSHLTPRGALLTGEGVSRLLGVLRSFHAIAPDDDTLGIRAAASLAAQRLESSWPATGDDGEVDAFDLDLPGEPGAALR